MTREGLQKIMDSSELTAAEKKYIFDVQFRMGGSFTLALFEAISRADHLNLARLAQGFPAEVMAYRAWTQGDLHERASAIAGGDCSFIVREEEPAS